MHTTVGFAVLVVLLAVDALPELCTTDDDCNGFKCFNNRCTPHKPCPSLQAPSPPDGCYYKIQQDDDGCLASTLRCKRKKAYKREIPECPKNSERSNCTDICGYPNCATMGHVRHCHSLRCGPPGCVCKPDHVFISANHSLGCVRKEECSKIVHKRHTEQHLRHRLKQFQCPPNEHFSNCGTACEPTCENLGPIICTMQCRASACQCNIGYYRHRTKGCVHLSEC